MRDHRGFTLIELMIVIGIIAIIASISIPNIIAARQNANERAAMATLRSICTAEAQFQTTARADEDDDGQGEFGGLGELSGAVPVRGGSVKVPTDLSGVFRLVTPNGEVNRGGYYFRLYLPDVNGEGVLENGGGGFTPGALEPNLSETTWCVYAWPANRGFSGQRVFFVNQYGEVAVTTDSSAEGAATGALTPGSAFVTTNPDAITGQAAMGTVGNDGSLWRKAN